MPRPTATYFELTKKQLMRLLPFHGITACDRHECCGDRKVTLLNVTCFLLKLELYKFVYVCILYKKRMLTTFFIDLLFTKGPHQTKKFNVMKT